MKYYFLFLIFNLSYLIVFSQTITEPQLYQACEEDGDGYVSIPFSILQEFALGYLDEFNQQPEIYVTNAQAGISKITNLYDDPQVISVCGNTDGQGGYYDIALNNQQEIYVVRQFGILQKLNVENCTFQNIVQIHPNGQTVLALSFDHLNHLYEGGWTSEVYRADAQDLTQFYLWHDFGQGRAAGDFVQIGNYLYVAWTVNNQDYLYKITLGNNNQYVNHENLGIIDSGTYGLAAEYGKIYGNTPNYLYEIDLSTMQTHIIKERPFQNNSSGEWWGAAGSHEALDISIKYFYEQADAINNLNEISDPYINDNPFDDWVYIRIHEEVQNITYIIPVHVVVSVAPVANDTELTSCADVTSGFAHFHLSDANNQINPDSALNFSYFNSLEDLQTNQNPLALDYAISTNSTVYAKVYEGNSENCFGIAILDLIIPSAENVDYDSTVSFCLGTEAVLNVPNQFESYSWQGLQGDDLNQNLHSNEVIITHPGNYHVEVKTTEGCNFSLPFETSLGGAPQIQSIEINTNSFSINVTPSGNYEYSLDGIFWQSSPVFENIHPDEYEIFVRDETGCRSEPYAFTFLQIPNFISPNGDGINDVWKILGIRRYPGSKFELFDRYGKMFAVREAEADDIVWDGMYLQRPVPTGTYWYKLTMKENNYIIKGYLTVKNN